MAGKKEKVFSQTSKENAKSRPKPEDDAGKAKRTQTPMGKTLQPGTSGSARRGVPTVEKEKKPNTKEDEVSKSKQVQSRRNEACEEKDIVWFGREKGDVVEQQESSTKNPRRYQEETDSWDETSEEDTEEESGEGITQQPQDKTRTRREASAQESEEDKNAGHAAQTQPPGTRTRPSKTAEDGDEVGKSTEESPILSRITETDKALMRALVHIASLAGDNEAIQEQLDNVLTAHSRMKSIIMEQTQEIAYQKGRITELERPNNSSAETSEKTTEQAEQEKPVRPSYALVVSGGNMEKKEVAGLIKKQVDLTKLGIENATMRPGRQGVVITTSSKEAMTKLEAHMKRRTTLQQLQVSRPKEPEYYLKIVGIA